MNYFTAFALLLASAVVVDAQFSNPPPLLETELEGFETPQTCGFIYGDPHMFTFDNRNMDCMGDGDYILSRSRTTDFEIQARFRKATPEGLALHESQNHNWDLGTFAKGVVIKTGFPNEPVIEIDADKEPDIETINGEEVATCHMNYYVDGALATFGADESINDGAVTFQRRTSYERSIWGNKDYYTNHYRNFYFKESGVFVQVARKKGRKAGCFMTIR